MSFRTHPLLIVLASGLVVLASLGLSPVRAEGQAAACPSGKRCTYLPLMVKALSAEAPCSIANVGFANPGFEDNTMGWAFDSLPSFDMVVAQPHHCGSYSVQLGKMNNQTASITQYVTIPADRPILRYWQYVDSQDQCSVPGWYYDRVAIYVNGNQDNIYSVCGPDTMPNKIWERVTDDLSWYAGQPVKLQIEFQNDGTDPSLLYLDDFAFVAQP